VHFPVVDARLQKRIESVAINDLAKYEAVNSTRRTIVKTGARLAYAAPVVAATMKVSGRSVGAQVVSGGGITVPGNALAGVSTGLNVVAGQLVCVSASGLVRLCVLEGDTMGRDFCKSGPEGNPDLGAACGAFTCGVLLGEVNGNKFVLGANGCANAPVSGLLSLIVSDYPTAVGYEDNDGSYQATVTV
jgi:hypothetical protein